MNDIYGPHVEPTPEPSARRSRGFGAVALLLVGLLVGGAVGGGAARYLSGASAIALPGERATTARATTAEAAVMDVVRRANHAQQDAFARNDHTLMRETATSFYYEQMVAMQRQLQASGITAIALTDLRFGDVAVTGSAATATTYETWRTTYRDSSSDQSTDRNDYTLVLDGGSWKVETSAQPESAMGVGSGSAPLPQPVSPSTGSRDVSSNWSGYAATGGTYTSVTGTWVVPQPSLTTSGIDATWVGIGGVTGRDLIQAGTQGTVSGGGVEYSAWIEMLPAPSQDISLSVKGGDTVTVTITEQSVGLWAIDMRNDTTARSYSTTVRYASSKSSAEWIQEAPSIGRRIVPLDDFGTLRFTGGSTVKDGSRKTLTGAGAKPVTMIDSTGQPQATPSVLGADGSSFTVTRATPRPVVPGTGRTRRGG